MALAFTDNFSLPMDWQLGKTLPESTGCLMRSERYADVWFRCKDHDQSVETDRVAAHQLILASRSPVFEAMFYGDLAESSNEILLPEIEKIPFLLFLRYLYTDETDLSEEHGVDVMQIAHKYQVTTCLKYCSKFLQGIVRVDNACCILETARLVDDKALERSVIDFIDDHATAVLESEGFLHINQDTLEFILQGDTFYAKEVDIIKAVDNWSAVHLKGQDMEVNPANKRNVMGGAFDCLRLPAMSLRNFVATQFQYGYLTDVEEKKISKFIIGLSEISQDLPMSCEARMPRETTCVLSSLLKGALIEPTPGQTLRNEVHLICTRDIELKEVMFSLNLKPQTHAECTIDILGNDKSKKVFVKEATLKFTNTTAKFTLSPIVRLYSSDTPYKMMISIAVKETLVYTNPVYALSTPAFGVFAAPSKPKQAVESPSKPKQAVGFLLGASSASVQMFQRRSMQTQTEDEIYYDGRPIRPAAGVILDTNDGRNSFINGIRYTNKSNRA